jgi:phospholipid/cholesterol/gamma-HCH transport system substrate-binding protein
MKGIPAWLSGVALVAVLTLGGSYIFLSVLQVNPAVEKNHVIVEMPESGGLRPGSEVVYRGLNIGTIESIGNIDAGVRVRLTYQAKYRIPLGSPIKVENLSALGEPILEFNPTTSDGPFLADGMTAIGSAVALPISVPQLLASISGLLDQLPPDTMRSLVATLKASVEGLDTAMPTIGRGAALLAATLVSHRPDLESNLRNAMIMFGNAEWLGPGLDRAAAPTVDYGTQLGQIVSRAFSLSVETQGRQMMDAWLPTFHKLTEILGLLGPDLGAISEALRPMSRATGPLLGSIDFGDLLAQALSALPGDRVRVAVEIPR